MRLKLWDSGESYERLGLDEDTSTILGVKIARATIPLVPGKNITVISEVVALNHLLKIYGHHPAEEFNRRLELDGVILTKLDGDTRGGAAISVKTVTGKPIKFVGMGEKLNDLEPFYPDRMASRILGMGDVVSLVEKAQDVIDQETAQEQMKKFIQAEFTFEDFLKQLQAVKKLGSIKDLLGHLP